jgi:hypothetical protein
MDRAAERIGEDEVSVDVRVVGEGALEQLRLAVTA